MSVFVLEHWASREKESDHLHGQWAYTTRQLAEQQAARLCRDWMYTRIRELPTDIVLTVNKKGFAK